MKKKKKKETKTISEENEQFPITIYEKGDDIYAREKRESLDEEDQPGERKPIRADNFPGEDLDIPGAELDDDEEEIGEEDEENNYYSLGGDNHEDLEEDKS